MSCSIKEYNESIQFSTLKNELSDGYWSQTLYGSNTGVRGFNLTMPTLTGSSASETVTGINGETVTKEEYLWSLYCEQEVTGVPFVMTSQRNGQYYLVRFADEQLSYSRMLTKLYSTGVNLRQVRVNNVSIFQPSLVSGLFGYWDSNTDFDSSAWDGTDGANTVTFTETGDVIDAAAQNGQQIKRFSNTSNTGYIESESVFIETVYDVIVAVKFREATFSNNCTLFAEDGEPPFISGDDTTTKFQDPGLSNFFYSLNGVEYAANNMQAPMNTWGVCHFRNLDGWNVTDGILFGADTSAGAANFAEMDLGDIVLLNKPSMQDCREIVEHMMIKFGI